MRVLGIGVTIFFLLKHQIYVSFELDTGPGLRSDLYVVLLTDLHGQKQSVDSTSFLQDNHGKLIRT
jgi:hypothetical protein